MNDKQIEDAVSAAFNKHRQKVGDHWSWEYAISEHSAEDFARDVLNAILPLLAGKVAGGDSRDTERLDWLEKNAHGTFNWGPVVGSAGNSSPLNRWGIDRAMEHAAPRPAQPEQKGEATQ